MYTSKIYVASYPLDRLPATTYLRGRLIESHHFIVGRLFRLALASKAASSERVNKDILDRFVD